MNKSKVGAAGNTHVGIHAAYDILSNSEEHVFIYNCELPSLVVQFYHKLIGKICYVEVKEIIQ